MAFEIFLAGSIESTIILLKDTLSGCEAEIFAFGGLLNAFRIPVKDGLQNVVEGFTDVADAKKNITNGFKSAKLSPFVCRMNKGIYHWEGITYQVQKHFMNGHAIHGILYDAVYMVAEQKTDQSGASITLVHQYAATDPGYPFPYELSITWKLETGNHLSVTTGIKHQNTSAIPLADGWHPYFSLGGEADEWVLQFSDAAQLEYDTSLLPTGKKIVDTRFLKGCSLQGIFLDSGFEWTDASKQNRCILSNQQLQLIIEPDSAYPVLQVYTPPHRKSIAIENLSGAPDNFNNGIALVRLPPGQLQTFTTSYTVTVL